MDKSPEEKKRLSAVCGLFCAACSLYIGTREDRQRLKNIAKHTGKDTSQWECKGCRSDKLSYYCRNLCYMKPCAREKGIDFCYECDEYPCENLKKFKEERPHRIELWESQDRIAEAGYSKWYDEKIQHYSCPDCNTIKSAYDISCRNCGREPCCKYVELHMDTIKKHLQKQG